VIDWFERGRRDGWGGWMMMMMFMMWKAGGRCAGGAMDGRYGWMDCICIEWWRGGSYEQTMEHIKKTWAQTRYLVLPGLPGNFSTSETLASLFSIKLGVGKHMHLEVRRQGGWTFVAVWFGIFPSFFLVILPILRGWE